MKPHIKIDVLKLFIKDKKRTMEKKTVTYRIIIIIIFVFGYIYSIFGITIGKY